MPNPIIIILYSIYIPGAAAVVACAAGPELLPPEIDISAGEDGAAAVVGALVDGLVALPGADGEITTEVLPPDGLVVAPVVASGTRFTLPGPTLSVDSFVTSAGLLGPSLTVGLNGDGPFMPGPPIPDTVPDVGSVSGAMPEEDSLSAGDSDSPSVDTAPDSAGDSPSDVSAVELSEDATVSFVVSVAGAAVVVAFGT